MKLAKCKEIAEACGLETWGEALTNISIHAMSYFIYDEIPQEMKELKDEFMESGFKTSDPINKMETISNE